jgi:excisionase family DNA binding protein
MTAHPTSESERDRSGATFTGPQRLQDVVASDPPQLRGTHSRGRAREQGPTGEPHDELLTVAEAGDYLGTGERFIRRLVAQRRISYIKLGKYVRLQRSALDAFIAAGRVPSD